MSTSALVSTECSFLPTPAALPGDESSGMARQPSPNACSSAANRSPGDIESSVKRSPSRHSPSLRMRCWIVAASGSDMPRSRLRAEPSGSGSEGWLATGARTAGSTAAASAKPPVKHMPITPTPGPPACACSERASARTYSATGRSARRANAWNSRVMHDRAKVGSA